MNSWSSSLAPRKEARKVAMGYGEGTVQREGEEGRGTGRETGMGGEGEREGRDRRERGRGTGREGEQKCSLNF